MRHGGVRGDEVGPHPVHPERGADRGDLTERGVGEDHLAQPAARLGYARGEVLLLPRPAGGEALGVVLEGQPPAYHLGTLVRVARGRDLHGEPESVEELGPQLALLGVHRADQDEPRRVPHGHGVALDVARAERGGVEEQVHEVVVQQVDLVHVQDAPVRGGEQAGVEGLHALGQRPFQVQRADQPVLRGPDAVSYTHL